MSKLTISDKIKIYELWKSGEKGVSELERLFDIKKDILRKFQDGDNPWQHNR